MRGLGFGVAVLWVCGCGSPAPPPQPIRDTPAPQPQPSVQAVTYETPELELSPRRTRSCTQRSRPPEEAMGYSFEPIQLYSVRFGPRSHELSGLGFERGFGELRHALVGSVKYFNGCYRWAKHGGRLGDVTVEVSMTIDPWGRASDVVVAGGNADLEQCVAAGIQRMTVDHLTPRRTKVTAAIAFRDSELGEPRLPPERPTPPQQAPPRAECLQTSEPTPYDVLETKEPIVTFDDWDADHWRAEQQRKHPGRRVPRMRTSCTTYSFAPNSEDILRAIEGNVGALQACYADEVARSGTFTATLDVALEIAESGLVEQEPRLQGETQRKELLSCVSRALQDIVVWPIPNAAARVGLTFQLSPTTPKAEGDTSLHVARARLELRDTAGALERFAALIRSAAGDEERECWGRLGVLETMLTRAPWIDDPRVWSATTAWLRFIRGKSGKRLSACVAAATPLVTRVGTWPFTFMETPSGVRRAAQLGSFDGGARGERARAFAKRRAEELLALAPNTPALAKVLALAVHVEAHDGDPRVVQRSLPKLRELGLKPEHMQWALSLAEKRLQVGEVKPTVARPSVCPPSYWE